MPKKKYVIAAGAKGWYILERDLQAGGYKEIGGPFDSPREAREHLSK